MMTSKTITPNSASAASKKEQVTQMFNDISSSYDRVNRFISLGMDRRWKKRLVKIVTSKNPQNVLDLATGTGDLPIQFVQKGIPQVTGLDISPKMLNEGQKRVDALSLNRHIKLVVGDSEALPFEDESFNAISISYGIRNFESLETGLKEAHRVLRKGGQLVILETSVPTAFPIKQCYGLFTKRIMPWIGGILSGDKEAYRYLSSSAINFPYGEALAKILNDVGFTSVIIKPQFFGATSIYICHK